jgi:hypothetical protein
MNKITTLFTMIILLMNGHRSFSQTFPVDTVLYNGDKAKLINLVMMGDGYLPSEQNKFLSDAIVVKDYLFSQSVFSNYINYFNAFAIEVPSIESGTNHPGTSPDPDCPEVPISTVNNYFGSSFDIAGIHRFVCIEHGDSVSNVLAANFPECDFILIIVNSPYFGGSGGFYLVVTTDASTGEVALHEIGHSFGRLADEYWSGYPWEALNETRNSDPSTMRWKNWLYDNGIGIYPLADNSWFRPHQSCKMRYINAPFCSVCSETLIENIHGLVNPVYSYFPSDSSTIKADTVLLNFSLDLLKPIPNTLKTTWTTDGTLSSINTDTFQIDPDTLTNGNCQLVATVIDTTILTRCNDHWISHIYSVSWNINKSMNSIDIDSQPNSADILIYPNPFTDKLKIVYHIDRDTRVEIEIIDAIGKILKKVINKRQSAGIYELTLAATEIKHTNSACFIKIAFDNYLIVKPIIHAE